MFDADAFWSAVVRQDREAIRPYFLPEAVIRWHCTGEQFTVEEYLRANCEYPGCWDGEVARRERMGDLLITVARVRAAGGEAAFHAVSFLRLAGERISEMDEYWGDDGPAPEWRRQMGIGGPIQPAKSRQ